MLPEIIPLEPAEVILAKGVDKLKVNILGSAQTKNLTIPRR
jgi:hypothetical protein